MRERLLATWQGFNEREKRLVGAMLVIAVLFIVLVPVFVVNQAIATLAEENDELASVLREIDRQRPLLAERAHARRAAEARYDHQAPALPSFLDAKASEVQLRPQSVTPQPEVQSGNFRRRTVRASLPSASLRSAVRLMNALEADQYPIALERIHIDHFAAGEDRYNLELGIMTYDRTASADTDAGVPDRAPRALESGRAGPPTP